MNKVPFSLPVIDQSVIDEVMDTLTNTGWLTTGPKVKQFEEAIGSYTNSKHVLCINSWTSGAMLILKWFGVGYGDEVIIPAYTYSATALAALNIGAIPVMVDVAPDSFLIDPDRIFEKVTSKTKAVIAVDLAGMPANYEQIFEIVKSKEAKDLFIANSDRQASLGRILVLADAAHSFGALYDNADNTSAADISIFSFHSVKNITTGEGGAVVLNLPDCFDSDKELKFLRAMALNGQTKSAYEKNQPGAWKYDIIDQGLKINMPDICASVGLAQIRKYREVLLPERKKIFKFYNDFFQREDWAILPESQNPKMESSCHLYLLRIKNFSEEMRDKLIVEISNKGVSVNVHYIPMAMLTLFKNLGYKMSDYPNTYNQYKNVITLPVYNNLSEESLELVVQSVKEAYFTVMNAT